MTLGRQKSLDLLSAAMRFSYICFQCLLILPLALRTGSLTPWVMWLLLVPIGIHCDSSFPGCLVSTCIYFYGTICVAACFLAPEVISTPGSYTVWVQLHTCLPLLQGPVVLVERGAWLTGGGARLPDAPLCMAAGPGSLLFTWWWAG